MPRAGLLQQQNLQPPVARRQRRGPHLRIVEHEQIVRAEILRQVVKMAMLHAVLRAVIDQQPRFLAPRRRMRRDQFRRQLELVVGRAGAGLLPVGKEIGPCRSDDARRRDNARPAFSSRRGKPRRASASFFGNSSAVHGPFSMYCRIAPTPVNPKLSRQPRKRMRQRRPIVFASRREILARQFLELRHRRR